MGAPKDIKIFELFKQQGKDIVGAADILKEIFEENYKNIDKKFKRIIQLEEDGDKVYQKISIDVYSIFLSPVDIEDILILAGLLEEILDSFKDLAYRLYSYRVKKANIVGQQLLEIIYECSKLIMEGLSRLTEFKDIADLNAKVITYEKQADNIYREGISQLFNEIEAGKSDDIKHLIVWKEIYEKMDAITDLYEKTYETMENIIIKHS